MVRSVYERSSYSGISTVQVFPCLPIWNYFLGSFFEFFEIRFREMRLDTDLERVYTSSNMVCRNEIVERIVYP